MSTERGGKLILPEGEAALNAQAIRELLCECGKVRGHETACLTPETDQLRLALQHCVDYLRAQAEREGYRSWPLRYAERVIGVRS